MGGANWVEGISDETNPWFNAVKMEDSGKYTDAVIFYMEDAKQNLKRKLWVCAALSCSCAAGCLEKIGDADAARRLYREAAALYLENANSMVGVSVRELLWSLQESYEHFLLAKEHEQADAVQQRYISLARRIDPFRGHAERVVISGAAAQSSEVQLGAGLPGDLEVRKTVQDFLHLSSSQLGTRRAKPARGDPERGGTSTGSDEESDYVDENSLINQLG